VSETAANDPSVYGPAAWQAIHLRGISVGVIWTPAIAGETDAWLRGEILPMLPATGCACRGDLASWLAVSPLRVGTDFFFWGWVLHNRVSVRLGKRSVRLALARATWTKIANGKNLKNG
jgi:hypothetical protein